MLKKHLLLMLLMALFAPWAMHAQNTVTVCDGTTTNNYIPVYGYYADTDGATSEFILPSTTSGLSDMLGAEITGMTFYISSPASSDWGSTFEVYMTEVDYTTQTSSWTGGGTVVYTGELDGTGTTMEITFDDAYVYQGGNLLIGTVVTSGDSYAHAYFYGIEAESGASINVYPSSGSYYGGARAFLPKTTFTYQIPDCPMPALTLNYTEGNTSATVSWTSDARSFNVKVNGTLVAEGINANSYTIGSIEPATTYTVSVQANCGDTQSRWATTSFFSGCPETFNVPYSNGFESEDAVNCWTLTPSSNMFVDLEDDSFAHTGSGFLFLNYTTTPPQYVISPQLGGFTNGLHVEFWYRQYTNGVETFHVGYSTTDNDPDSFTWGDEITASTTYQRFSANYPAGTKYVAVKHTSDDQYYLFLDDFLFEESSSCLEPTSVAASNVTTTGATIDWRAGADETTWDIYVTRDATDVPDDTTTPTVVNVTSTNKPYSLTSLTPATIYYVYVRAKCDATTTSAWSSPAIFNTECEGMALPYTEDFESGELSVCWNTIIENTSYTGIDVMSLGTNQVLAFYLGHYANPNLAAVLPEVDATYPLSGYRITFDACYANTSSSSSTSGKLNIGVMTDPTDFTTFTLVEEVTFTDGYNSSASNFGMQSHEVWLNAYTGSGRYIAIQAVYTNGGYVCVDNIAVTELPSCLPPTALSATPGATSAVLSWTANNSETEWTIYYKESSAAEYTRVTDVTTNPYTLSGLTAATNYEYYVVAKCSASDASEPSEVYSFTSAMCEIADQCEITFELTDSFGDGWNGNAIQVVDVLTNVVLGEFANTNAAGGGEAQTYTLSVCDGRAIDFVWVSGSYASETSYIVYDRNHDEIFSGSAGSGLVTNYVVDCSVPTCAKPTNLSATPQTTSAVLSWTANSGETAWTIFYKKVGATDYTEEAVASNPYTLRRLDAGSTYEYYVVANCSATETSDPSATFSFTTECEPFTITAATPYTQDFETPVVTTTYSEVGVMPVCWENYPTTYASAKILAAGARYNYASSGQVLYFYGSGNNYAVLPEFTNALNELQISFKYATESSSYGTLTLGYITDVDTDYDSFTEIEHYDASSASDDTFVDVPAIDLSALPANAARLVFKWYYSSQWGCNVDDVEVSLLPVTTVTQDIALSSGWNWVSFNVDITMDDLKAALVAAMPTATIMIKAENGDNVSYYGGGRWRGDDFSLDLTRMYRIQTTAAGTISLTGMPINAASQTVTLNQGFNLIAFPLSTSMTLTDAFSTVVGNGDMVKNSAGLSSTYNGRWRGDAFDLEPGQGYVYQRAASGSATFTFPSAK